ncbi:hypothetical protein M0805_002100 [Coniferiporia weirii]|nr:hypothetical protein M0805_002100 [Coniferiporia weirii]
MSPLQRLVNAALGRSSKSHEQKCEDSCTLQPGYKKRNGNLRAPYFIVPIDGSFERGASGSAETTSAPGGFATHGPYCEVCDEYFPLESALYQHRLESCLEASNLSLCPFCSVICSVSEHLTWAVHHRCSQKLPAGQAMLETDSEWPRPCSECKAMLRSPHDKKKHYEIIWRHNEIIRRSLVESAVDPGLHICWPCDQYFDSEAGLTQHRTTCTSPLRYLTRLEGELLAAISRDTNDPAAGNYAGDNNPRTQPVQESGQNLPAPSSSLHARVEDIPEERSPRAASNAPSLQTGGALGTNTFVPRSSSYRRVEDVVSGQHQTPYSVTTSAGAERRPSLQRTNPGTVENGTGRASPLLRPFPFTPSPTPEEGAPPSYLATILQDRPNSLVLDNPQRMPVSNTDSSSDARSLPISHYRIVRDVLSPSSPTSSSNPYECPLCLERRRDLSNIPCGHVFCTPCIMESLGMDQHCPLCRSPAEGTDARKIFLA